MVGSGRSAAAITCCGIRGLVRSFARKDLFGARTFLNDLPTGALTQRSLQALETAKLPEPCTCACCTLMWCVSTECVQPSTACCGDHTRMRQALRPVAAALHTASSGSLAYSCSKGGPQKRQSVMVSAAGSGAQDVSAAGAGNSGRRPPGPSGKVCKSNMSALCIVPDASVWSQIQGVRGSLGGRSPPVR
jgi:hypothetical protein